MPTTSRRNWSSPQRNSGTASAPQLLDAELVAFWVPHDNPVLPALREHLDLRSPDIDEGIYVMVDGIDAIDIVHAGTPAGVDVEMDAILGGLAFWHPLEEQTRANAVRIDQGAGVIPILLGNLYFASPVIPRIEPGRRRRDDVLESDSPELGQGGRVVGIERYLDRDTHVPETTPPSHHDAARPPWYRFAVDLTPSQLLAELQAIREELDSLRPGSSRRSALEERRMTLRQQARDLADETRDSGSLRKELEHLEKRLAGFDSDKIEVPAWQMSMATVNDPAAHARKINEEMDKGNATDRESIERRIRQLRKALAK